MPLSPNLSCQGVGAIGSFLGFDIIHVDCSPLTSFKALLLSIVEMQVVCVVLHLFSLSWCVHVYVALRDRSCERF